MFDDTHLIDELQDRLHERAATIDIPDGLAADIRARARRRTTRRAVAAGAPVLAAAGVVAALAVSDRSAAPTAHLTTSAPARSVAAARAGGPGHAVDTAYVVRRARAQLVSAADEVLQSTFASGENWFYVDPTTGVQYQRTVNGTGTTTSSWFAQVATPIDHVLHFHTVDVLVAPAWTSSTHQQPGHTWSVDNSVASGPEGSGTGGVAPGNIDSTAAQIRRALSSGEVHQDGTATVDGIPAIRLALPASADTSATLYVDASTDQPLQEIDSSGDNTTTERWLPATPTNIALAKAQPIPAGYTQVPAQP